VPEHTLHSGKAGAIRRHWLTKKLRYAKVFGFFSLEIPKREKASPRPSCKPTSRTIFDVFCHSRGAKNDTMHELWPTQHENRPSLTEGAEHGTEVPCSVQVLLACGLVAQPARNLTATVRWRSSAPCRSSCNESRRIGQRRTHADRSCRSRPVRPRPNSSRTG